MKYLNIIEHDMNVEKAKKYLKNFKYVHIMWGVYKSDYKKIHYYLNDLEYDSVFWPAIKKVKDFKKHNKITEKLIQLYPNYAYLLTKKKIKTLFFKDKSYRLLEANTTKNTNNPHCISHQKFLKTVEKACEYKYKWFRKINHGDLVRCTAGPFKNFTGDAIADQNKDKVKIEINALFNRKIICEMKVKNLVKI